jgi:hypothetical protein
VHPVSITNPGHYKTSGILFITSSPTVLRPLAAHVI